jgi:hypothetical protein
VEIIHQRVVEKGPAGQAGKTVTERKWTTGGGGSEIQATNQSSVTGAPLPKTDLSGLDAAQPRPAVPLSTESPFGGLSDPFGFGGNAAPTTAAPTNQYTKPLSDLATASAPASNYNSLGSCGGDPYGTLGSLRSGPNPYDCSF